MELDFLLTKLKMDHLDAKVETLCEQAAQRELDYRSFLTEALAVEWQGRDRRGIEARLRQARLPWIKTLEQFDFEFQPSLDRRQMRELASLRFVERAHNIVILGPPGVGKPQPINYPYRNDICTGSHGHNRRSTPPALWPDIAIGRHHAKAISRSLLRGLAPSPC